MAVIREVVGGNLDEHTLRLAAFYIRSPLTHLTEMKARPASARRAKRQRSAEDPEALAETLYTFALAGLRELSRQHGEEN